MDNPANLPFAPLIAAYIANASRLEQEYIAHVVIDALDHGDGDTDLEGEWSEDEISSKPTWVSLDDGPGCQIADAGGQCDEDDFNTNQAATFGAMGPGCELSDPDAAVDDSPCDPDEGV